MSGHSTEIMSTKEQDSQCLYNVTVRRAGATTVVVEKQYDSVCW